MHDMTRIPQLKSVEATVIFATVVGALLPSISLAEPLSESEAIEQIALVGGTVERNEFKPGQPVTAVKMNGERVSDEYFELLPVFEQLTNVNLDRAGITNAGDGGTRCAVASLRANGGRPRTGLP